MTLITKPQEMFDRDVEWGALERLVADPAPGATLGVVSGRRRQGKTFLLRALCQATGGFYFAADEASDVESLRAIGTALADHLRAPAPFNFPGWSDAIDALLSLGRERRIPAVIDEFPYLVKANPRLPSTIQNALAPLRSQRDSSSTTLLLCGSAMSFMGKLLSGNAPLRGRASFELVVPTLNYQLAAEFWQVEDPLTALKVHAVVGGTPAYRREFVRNDTPTSPGDFDPWILRSVLSPSSPLFREARYLLAEEPDLRDTGIYHSVLAAIAQGNNNRSGIASYLGRKSSDLSHALTVLEDCGLVTREPDVFRENRTRYRIAEPLLTFYHSVMRPVWADLEQSRDPAGLWQRSQQRFLGQVLGPHFERICRYWIRHLAPLDLLDLPPNQVGAGTVNDPVNRTSHEVDVVAFGLDDDNRAPLLALGEAKWGQIIGMSHVERLRRIRALLVAQGRLGAETARLMCFSAAGFTDEVRELAARTGRLHLVGPIELYGSV